MAKVKNPFIEALAKVAESQDISSFKKIFDYFSPRLKSFLMRSGADEAIAEEIIQETMTLFGLKQIIMTQKWPRLARGYTQLLEIRR